MRIGKLVARKDGTPLADVRREMERLRPVYETGVLRLLLRGNSMLYVALLRSTFDPLTGELPREIVEERFSRSLTRLAETGDYTQGRANVRGSRAHDPCSSDEGRRRRLRLARQFARRRSPPLPVPSHGARPPCDRGARPARGHHESAVRSAGQQHHHGDRACAHAADRRSPRTHPPA